jgi:hypothetical protein
MQNYITMQTKVRRSAIIGGDVLPTRSAPTA